jgi:hypothetical protein
MVVDSRATSHFMRPEENLPNTGPSEKVVMLPNGATIKASHTTNMPFESLSDKAQRADVLPALKQNSLVIVGKFVNANYTTKFHPHGEGVMVNKSALSSCVCYISQSSKGGEMPMVCGACLANRKNQRV